MLLRKGDPLDVNDGLYGSLEEMRTAGLRLRAQLHRRDGAPVSRDARSFTLNGPTCDSTDVLPQPFTPPEDAGEGDWIELFQLGAYPNAVATNFNGF